MKVVLHPVDCDNPGKFVSGNLPDAGEKHVPYRLGQNRLPALHTTYDMDKKKYFAGWVYHSVDFYRGAPFGGHPGK